MERDIVQFVPFADYRSDPLLLAKQTLEEVPRQLTSYMHAKRILPGNPALSAAGAPGVPGAGRVNFFEEDRRQFKAQLQAMSYSEEKMDPILRQGLPAASVDLFLQHEPKSHSYKNVLASP
jgi:hypothetical protein